MPDNASRRTTVASILAVPLTLTAATTRAEPKGANTMERVEGIGGFFFRAHDPAKLAAWYDTHLGVNPVPTSYDAPSWETKAGTTVFAPFAQDTGYFGKASQAWMINFRVASLDRMAAQLRASGITVEIDAETYPNGRFAQLSDPEGNPIQLWEPKG